MKKKLLFVAVTVLALASCSSDETVAVKQESPISFRPFVEGVTRTANGAGLKTAWETGDKLYVYAAYNGGKLFQDQFVKEATGGFNSTAKHYWPTDMSASKKVTFTAFWGAAQKTWSASNDENQLNAKYTVDNDVTKHMDLLIAKKEVGTKPTAGTGVELNFRHMLSQIAVKVRNTEANMKITVTGVRIGYVAKDGTFIYTGGVTDTETQDGTNSGGATLVARTNWTIAGGDAATDAAGFRFDQNVTATVLTGSTAATNLTDFKSYIMMPQELNAADDYSARATNGSVTADPTLNGAYIALKMTIEGYDPAANSGAGATTGTLVAEQWCYWPIGTEWKPGYKYTYTIDAGQGGYQPTDQNNTVGLDPIFGGDAYIWFSPDCTIDYWVDANYVVSMPVARTESYAFANGTTETINLGAGENGDYTFEITDLAAGYNVTAAATNNFTASPTVTDNGNGKVTITGTLLPNGSTSVTSAITITDTNASQSMTINIVQAAP